MKKFNTLTLILFILLSFNFKTKAQEDTVIIENSTEPIKESDFNQKRQYKYLDNNLREEKILLKLGLSPLSAIYFNQGFGFSGTFATNLGFERKLSPAYSILVDNNFKFQKNGDYYLSYFYSIDIGLRYYYSMKNKIKNGISANNFHNNYLSIKLEQIYYYKYSEITTTDYSYQKYKETRYWEIYPYLNLSWGMQRRVGKWFYYDLGPYIKFNEFAYGFGLNLQLGLGLGK